MGDSSQFSMLRIRRVSAPMEFPYTNSIRLLPRNKAFESISHEGSCEELQSVLSNPDVSTLDSQLLTQLGYSQRDDREAQSLQKLQQFAAAVTANTSAGTWHVRRSIDSMAPQQRAVAAGILASREDASTSLNQSPGLRMSSVEDGMAEERDALRSNYFTSFMWEASGAGMAERLAQRLGGQRAPPLQGARVFPQTRAAATADSYHQTSGSADHAGEDEEDDDDADEEEEQVPGFDAELAMLELTRHTSTIAPLFPRRLPVCKPEDPGSVSLPGAARSCTPGAWNMSSIMETGSAAKSSVAKAQQIQYQMETMRWHSMPNLAGNPASLWRDGFLPHSNRRHTFAAFPTDAAMGGNSGEGRVEKDLHPRYGPTARRASFASFGNSRRATDAYAYVNRRRRDTFNYAAAEGLDRRATTSSLSGAVSGWDSRRGTAQNSMELGVMRARSSLARSSTATTNLHKVCARENGKAGTSLDFNARITAFQRRLSVEIATDSQIFMNLWLIDSMAQSGCRAQEAGDIQLPDEEPGDCVQDAALEASRLDSLGAFKPLNCLPLEETEPENPVSLECTATLLGLQFEDKRLEEAFLAHLCTVQMHGQAALFAVVGVILGACAVYPATLDHAAESSTWLQALEMETAIFFAACAIAIWCSSISSRARLLLKMPSRYQTMLVLACAHAICSLDMVPWALAEKIDVRHPPFTTPARTYDDPIWHCANTPFSMAMLQCVVINLVNVCVGMTYRHALRLNGIWVAARFLMLWPEWAAALEWEQASCASATQCLAAGAGCNQMCGFTRLQPMWFIFTLMVLLTTHAVSLRLCYLREQALRMYFAKAKKKCVQDEVLQSAIGQMVPKRFQPLHTQFNWRGTGVDLQPELLVESFNQITIMFCSFRKDDVTTIGDPYSFLKLIGAVFSRFDLLVRNHQLFKVEHVCEDYVVASSEIVDGEVPKDKQDRLLLSRRNAQQMVKLAQRLLDVAEGCTTPEGKKLHFSVGIHTGPVMGGIAGIQRRFYRLFGDTVNTAARMCQHAPPGRIQVSAPTALLLEHSDVVLESAGEIVVKGKGLAQTFLVDQVGLEVERGYCSDARTSRTSRLSRHSFLSKQGIQLREMLAFGLSKGSTCAVESMEAKGLEESVQAQEIEQSSENLHLRWWDQNFSSLKKEGLYLMSLQRTTHHAHTKFCLSASSSLPLLYMMMIFVPRYSHMPEGVNWQIFLLGVMSCAAQFGLRVLVYLFGHEAFPFACTCAIGIAANSMAGLAMIGAESRASLLGLTMMLCAARDESNTFSKVMLRWVVPIIVSYTFSFSKGERMWTEMGVHASFLVCSTVSDRRFNSNLRHLWQLSMRCVQQRDEVMQVWFDMIPSTGARKFLLGRQASMMKAAESLAAMNSLEVAWAKPDSEEAAVLTFDLENFTPISERLGSFGVVELLHDLWCIMDSALAQFQDNSSSKLAEFSKHDQCNAMANERAWRPLPFKMDTVGDAYIVVVLIDEVSPSQRQASVDCLLNVARAIARGIDKYSQASPHGLPFGLLQGRMGLCIDRVVAGVVGITQPRYHIYGEAIKRSAQLEAQSLPCHVRVDNVTSQYCGYQELIDLLVVQTDDLGFGPSSLGHANATLPPDSSVSVIARFVERSAQVGV